MRGWCRSWPPGGASTDSQSADVALVAAAQADRLAFATLYERYQAALLRHLDTIVRSEASAQDLLQEVFLRVWTRADQWSGQGSFRSWLYRIATNLALNHVRAQRRRPSEMLEGADEGGWDPWTEEEIPAPGWLVDTSTLGPPESLEQAEEGDRLRRAIAGILASIVRRRSSLSSSRSWLPHRSWSTHTSWPS